MQHVQKFDQFALTAAKIVKPMLLAAAGLLIGVQANKLITGNQLRNVRFVEKNGLKGAVIDGDTLWAKKIAQFHKSK